MFIKEGGVDILRLFNALTLWVWARWIQRLCLRLRWVHT